MCKDERLLLVQLAPAAVKNLSLAYGRSVGLNPFDA